MNPLVLTLRDLAFMALIILCSIGFGLTVVGVCNLLFEYAKPKVKRLLNFWDTAKS